MVQSARMPWVNTCQYQNINSIGSLILEGTYRVVQPRSLTRANVAELSADSYECWYGTGRSSTNNTGVFLNNIDIAVELDTRISPVCWLNGP